MVTSRTEQRHVAYHLSVMSDVEVHSVGICAYLRSSVIDLFVVYSVCDDLTVSVVFLFKREKQAVVAVYYQRSLSVRALEYFKLRVKDTLLRAEIFHMGISYIGYHADIGL